MKKKTMENELIQNGIVVIIYPMYVQDLHLKINVKNFLDIKIFKGDHNSNSDSNVCTYDEYIKV